MESLTNIDLLERELSLKQLQIKSLLYITQSINQNVSADGLFEIYRKTLSWELSIKKMALFFREANGEWVCKAEIGASKDFIQAENMGEHFLEYSRVSNLVGEEVHPLSLIHI